MISPADNIITDEQPGRALQQLYRGDAITGQRERYASLMQRLAQKFQPEPGAVRLFSTPGRTEVGGNHTDHNGGRVLAAAVDLDIIAAAATGEGNTVTVESTGYPAITIDIRDLAPRQNERFTSAALVRGVCARMKELGHVIGGFSACIDGRVPKGAGLSSSAAFEVLVATIIDHLYNHGTLDPVANAQIAQYAENRFFGKPCGLMDQTTCACGGFVFIDFDDFEKPIVEKVGFDFASSGYAMVIVDTGGNHADLNDDYTALEHEMKSVAVCFGRDVLRRVPPQDVVNDIARLRTQVNDRAILRAIHFHDDDARVVQQVSALRSGEFNRFLDRIIESGNSSWMLCQNCYSHTDISRQGISIALAVSERLLRGSGAWRVHGGGFAGTIQAFVPTGMLDVYLAAMNGIFGERACHKVMIREQGSVAIC